ncbi:uncharacterized protein F5147DRAFT_710793, partial [Suillus discolor]
ELLCIFPYQRVTVSVGCVPFASFSIGLDFPTLRHKSALFFEKKLGWLIMMWAAATIKIWSAISLATVYTKISAFKTSGFQKTALYLSA